MNKIGILVGFLVVALGGFFIIQSGTDSKKETHNAVNFKDATYVVGGESVTLKNGVSEVEAAPGSASKVTTKYFGNEVTGDLNGDGVTDIAFLLTQSSGGSGTFYYVVAAIKTTDGYKGTDAVLLGDRIAPQTTEIKDGKLTVNYADRKVGESFAVQPSVAKSLYFALDSVAMKLNAAGLNFDGEAENP